MSRSIRLAAAGVLTAMLAACSGGGANLAPTPQRPSAAHTSRTTFTMKWTNPSASASVRRKASISPSAQSVSVAINAKPVAVVNRDGNPTQTIALDAPVGTDQFIFNVYDQINTQGHLIGSATVTKQIVDGAANTVTAVIVAECAATNIAYAHDDAYGVNDTYSPPVGLLAPSLTSLVLAGQSSATLIVGPEDVDGNIIIASLTGTVPYTITGSATVTAIDGAHIRLTPVTGPRTTVADTLTVAAPGCPTTTVAVRHSPAIYAETTSHVATIYDWYGDNLGGHALANMDALIGYDTQTQKMIAYDPHTGNVSAYSLDLTSSAPLFTVAAGAITAWSNYSHAVFGAQPAGFDTSYFLATAARDAPAGQITPGNTSSVAASTFSTNPYVFASNGGAIYQFNLTTNGELSTGASNIGSSVALATDDPNLALFAFNGSGEYVSQYPYFLSGSPTSSNDGFTAVASVGAMDTDNDDIYAILADGMLAGSSFQGTPLSGFGRRVGSGAALVVVSTNEH